VEGRGGAGRGEDWSGGEGRGRDGKRRKGSVVESKKIFKIDPALQIPRLI